MLMVIGNKAIECYCYLPLQRAVLRIQYEHIGLSLGNQNITFLRASNKHIYHICVPKTSGGCSPVKWLSQTRRNLIIESLDLNFASRRKLCENSVFYENMNTVAFILFGKVFIFSRFCSFPFRKCIPLPSLSDIHILRDSVPDLNISTRSVTVDTFNWLKTIFLFAWGSRWRSGNWLIRHRS